jgi:hypothetical protein
MTNPSRPRGSRIFPFLGAELPAAPVFLLVFLLVLGLSSCGSDDPVGVDGGDSMVSAPTSTISLPARGAFLTEGTTDDMNITIEGEVCDAVNPITSVVLNGAPVTLSGSGECRSFTADLNSSWGLNVLDGLVTNELGNEVALVQSYVRSGEYFAPPIPSGNASHRAASVEGISDAFRARLGQDAIDDGDRADLDDLLTLVNLAIAKEVPALNSFLNSKMPNPFVDTVNTESHECLLQTRRNREGVIFRPDGSFNVRSLRITELTVQEGQLIFGIAVGAVSMPLAVAGYLDNACLGEVSTAAKGSVGISSAAVRAAVFAEQVEGKMQYRADVLGVAAGNVNVDVELEGLVGWFDGFISAALSTVGTVFVDVVEFALNEWIGDLLPTLASGVVGMDQFDLGDLKAPLLDVTVKVETETNLVDPGNGFIDYGVTANAYPTAYAKSPEELAAGTIIGSSMLPAFGSMNGSFGLGLKHDFINQVFWAYWAGGGFDFDGVEGMALQMLNDALPVEGLTVNSMELTLPPMLMPGETESELRLGVGGIVLKADIEQTTPSLFEGQPDIAVAEPLTIYLAIFVTVEFGIDPHTRRLVLAFTGDFDTRVEIESAIRNEAIVELESSFAQAAEYLVQALVEDVSKSIPLPSLPIGRASIAGIPEGLVWVMKDGVLDQTSGYVRVLGSIGVAE